ncbi:outer membrane protein [Mesorhizobium sp. INR15]|uniref:outer membrane protein n=1 Tax=Mesorhizobium sp. INR15 TaxID=2654248 RepID=UPI0018964B13|nr:outer membrane protein [Mesorhizobium sp. INR15]QPC91000.1 outer membrane beta-barrel protein [Mesorhizobium sp. INR15]
MDDGVDDRFIDAAGVFPEFLNSNPAQTGGRRTLVVTCWLDFLLAIEQVALGILGCHMRISKRVLALVSLCVGLSGQALAAETTTYDWSGAYIGVQGGKAWSNPQWEGPPPAQDAVFSSIDGDGPLGGLYGGYNFQAGGWVFGLESEFLFADIDKSGHRLANCEEGMAFCASKIKWMGDVSARAGFALDRSLLYATGGVAFVGMDNYIGGQENGPEPGVLYTKGSDNRIGWTIGGGLEYAFFKHITGRVEYSYYDFGTASKPMTYVKQPDAQIAGFERKLTAQSIKFGLSYKF